MPECDKIAFIPITTESLTQLPEGLPTDRSRRVAQCFETDASLRRQRDQIRVPGRQQGNEVAENRDGYAVGIRRSGMIGVARICGGFSVRRCPHDVILAGSND